MLVKLPLVTPASVANVLQVFSDKLNSIAQPKRKSMNYDQAREMAMHAKLAQQTGITVYGSDENMSGLVRQYLPKGTDLSGHSQKQLDAIADETNGRPRKVLNVRSPLAVYQELLLNSSQPSPLTH